MINIKPTKTFSISDNSRFCFLKCKFKFQKMYLLSNLLPVIFLTSTEHIQETLLKYFFHDFKLKFKKISFLFFFLSDLFNEKI